jgi:hypothetical protein
MITVEGVLAMAVVLMLYGLALWATWTTSGSDHQRTIQAECDVCGRSIRMTRAMVRDPQCPWRCREHGGRGR